MIHAEFFESKGKLSGFKVSGHAGYADSGNDIVCASVSSAVQLSANIITEGFHIKADVKSRGNTVKFTTSSTESSVITVIEMLKNHLEILSEDFPKTIKITTTEV
jgi:uncharacterized protein YsxB (DUF464 family)